MSGGQRNITCDIKNVKRLGVPVGSQAPEIDLAAIDGKTVRLSEYRGKIVFIDFWATWCAPCVAELPNVKEAYEKYHKDGLEVISISFDSDAKTAEKFAQRKGMTWTQIWAKGGDKSDLAKQYGVAGIPATFLIGPDGKCVAKDLRGGALVERIGEEVAKLRNGRVAAKPTE